jgi:pimeloyl-ACP methyl ester carboxylesterase
MPERSHVVAHSYGGVSALLAACTAPERFASLTIIEAPLWSLAPQDAEVQELLTLARAFVRGAPEAREAFLAVAGLPLDHEETRRTERLARALRDPGEAVPQLDRLRAANLAIAVVSGAHNHALERASDALAEAIGAERWVLPGAGHAVQRVPELNRRVLARFGAPAVGR